MAAFHNLTMDREGPPTIQNSTKSRRNLPAFRPSGKLNKIWIHLKFIEKKLTCCSTMMFNNWTTKQSVKYVWVTSNRGNWENTVVISRSKWSSAVRGRIQSRLFPTFQWFSLPATSHRGSYCCIYQHCSISFPLPPTERLPQSQMESRLDFICLDEFQI